MDVKQAERNVFIRYINIYDKISYILKDDRLSWNSINNSMFELIKTFKNEQINIIAINSSRRHFTNIVNNFCGEKNLN